MPRPRIYDSNAEKQRAARQRKNEKMEKLEQQVQFLKELYKKETGKEAPNLD